MWPASPPSVASGVLNSGLTVSSCFTPIQTHIHSSLVKSQFLMVKFPCPSWMVQFRPPKWVKKKQKNTSWCASAATTAEWRCSLMQIWHVWQINEYELIEEGRNACMDEWMNGYTHTPIWYVCIHVYIYIYIYLSIDTLVSWQLDPGSHRGWRFVTPLYLPRISRVYVNLSECNWRTQKDIESFTISQL